jgi:hypothetical protein
MTDTCSQTTNKFYKGFDIHSYMAKLQKRVDECERETEFVEYKFKIRNLRRRNAYKHALKLIEPS